MSKTRFTRRSAIVTSVVVGSKFRGRRLRNFPDGVWIFDRSISIDGVESFRDLSDTVWLFGTQANSGTSRLNPGVDDSQI